MFREAFVCENTIRNVTIIIMKKEQELSSGILPSKTRQLTPRNLISEGVTAEASFTQSCFQTVHNNLVHLTNKR